MPTKNLTTQTAPAETYELSTEVQSEIEQMIRQDRGNAYQPLKLFGVVNKDRIWISLQGTEEPIGKFETLDCHIVAAVISRAAYGTKDQRVPSCSSINAGKTGNLHPEYGVALNIPDGQPCATCPWNKFGTGRNEDGTPGKGKFCKERRNILALTQEFSEPVILSISPSSLNAWDSYVSGLTQMRPPSYFVAHKTRVSVTVKKENNNEFGLAVFESLGKLPEADVKNAFALRAEFQPLLERVAATNDTATIQHIIDPDMPDEQNDQDMPF